VRFEPPLKDLEDFFNISNDLTVDPWNKIKIKLKELNIGLSMFKFLGQGYQGLVYQINNKTVIKITTDENEANASIILKNNPSPLFVKIRDVFGINYATDHQGTSKKRFIIIEEKLKKCKFDWELFVDFVLEDFVCPPLETKVIAEAKKVYFPGTNKASKRKTEQKFNWLCGVASYLENHQIYYRDLHGGNVMRKGHNHKIIDLGYASCPTQMIQFI
jgi:hypothetical protein